MLLFLLLSSSDLTDLDAQAFQILAYLKTRTEQKYSAAEKKTAIS